MSSIFIVVQLGLGREKGMRFGLAGSGRIGQVREDGVHVTAIANVVYKSSGNGDSVELVENS